jgi:hypothetical protein
MRRIGKIPLNFHQFILYHPVESKTLKSIKIKPHFCILMVTFSLATSRIINIIELLPSRSRHCREPLDRSS